jgi:hypothetical protein
VSAPVLAGGPFACLLAIAYIFPFKLVAQGLLETGARRCRRDDQVVAWFHDEVSANGMARVALEAGATVDVERSREPAR